MKLEDMATALTTGPTYLSEVYNDRKKPGVGLSRKLGALTGHPWQEFLVMPGKEIKARVIKALEQTN